MKNTAILLALLLMQSNLFCMNHEKPSSPSSPTSSSKASSCPIKMRHFVDGAKRDVMLSGCDTALLHDVAAQALGITKELLTVKYNGQELPAGTLLYMIKLNPRTQVLAALIQGKS